MFRPLTGCAVFLSSYSRIIAPSLKPSGERALKHPAFPRTPRYASCTFLHAWTFAPTTTDAEIGRTKAGSCLSALVVLMKLSEKTAGARHNCCAIERHELGRYHVQHASHISLCSLLIWIFLCISAVLFPAHVLQTACLAFRSCASYRVRVVKR